MIAGASPQLATGWVTPCCDRTPEPLAAGRFACRVCGLVYVDTAKEVRRVFGPDVVRCVVAEHERLSPLPMDVWWNERWLDT